MPGLSLRWLLSDEGELTYAKYLTYVRLGAFPHVAARSVGIVPSTLRDWLNRGRYAKTGGHHRIYNDTMQAVAEASSLAEAELRKGSVKTWLQTGPRRYLGDEWRDEPQQTYSMQMEGMIDVEHSGAIEKEGGKEGGEVLKAIAELRKAGISIDDVLDRTLAGDTQSLVLTADLDYGPPSPLALPAPIPTDPVDHVEAVTRSPTPDPTIPTRQVQLRPIPLSTLLAGLSGLRPNPASQVAPVPLELRPSSGGTPVGVGSIRSTSFPDISSPEVNNFLKFGTPTSPGSIQGPANSGRKPDGPQDQGQELPTEAVEFTPYNPPSLEETLLARSLGSRAQKDGKPFSANPYSPKPNKQPKLYKAWVAGYLGEPIPNQEGGDDMAQIPTNKPDLGALPAPLSPEEGLDKNFQNGTLVSNDPITPKPIDISSFPEKPVRSLSGESRGINSARSEEERRTRTELIHRLVPKETSPTPESQLPLPPKPRCQKCNSPKITKTRSGKVMCLKCSYVQSLHSTSTDGQRLPSSMVDEHEELKK